MLYVNVPGALPFLERSVGLVCPADRDYADYIVEYLADPSGTLQRQQALLAKVESLASASSASTPSVVQVFDQGTIRQAHSKAKYGTAGDAHPWSQSLHGRDRGRVLVMCFPRWCPVAVQTEALVCSWPRTVVR